MEMDPKIIRSGLVRSAFLLGLGLVVSTFVAGSVAYKVKSLGNTISVTGSAERSITSDIVKWSGRLSRNVAVDGLKDGNVAVKADLATALQVVHDAGVDDGQITVRPLNVYPVYGSDEPGKPYAGQNRIVGYNLDQSFQVESPDVKGVTKLAQDVADRMLQSGVVFTTDSLEYYYTKLADLKLQMLSEATENAKARAERIVTSTGAKLGPLSSAGMGVFQVTAVNSTEISDYGAYDTSSIDKKVTAVARAEFLLR
ncbi:MAG TPA: SIMPL domain-containing protein [Patescibacteria group bacterium]|nr:SIMPL domain-containing protein [Patescibacteria group bacterium]